MSMTVFNREELEQTLALLEDAATSDDKVRAAAEMLKHALRAAETRGLLTTAEAAEALGIRSINTVKRWVNTGYMHGVKRNERTMIPLSEVERIWHDDRVRDQRALSKLHEEIADFGHDMTQEEMDGLRAGRPGRLPWER